MRVGFVNSVVADLQANRASEAGASEIRRWPQPSPLDGEHTTDASSRRFVGLDGFAAVTSRERPRRVCRIPPANEHDRVYEPYGIGGSHRAQLRVGSDQLCGL